ncbi:hypothetical protein [Thermococcus sp. Bubb.Bath]|uniref:hypothetical protein n=1 Tax=Thermococcus sp. Bubb.Bath TaxID=1638242 RepID=UPI00143C5849|nr:hypothetical protein [Thermococcus sp. Bubb.Bath]NJF24558.1 hypothetical protein [Thermococcus sp. Bubb.Bath]
MQWMDSWPVRVIKMNTWAGVIIVLGISFLIYFYFKTQISTPKAGLIAITTYILLGLAMVVIGWNISPWAIPPSRSRGGFFGRPPAHTALLAIFLSPRFKIPLKASN